MPTQTHIVIKIKDAEEFLNQRQLGDLFEIAAKIEQGRRSVGKRENSYIIVNEDEPYSGVVHNVVLLGERKKLASK